ncbi:MAG TPA: Clp protease N-terminal domain-containing protein [Candidatus Acidoferrales bacterium]|nr:Clp protease N-terminal domain-containing protein [Candidatus Acidoferrales bacterium]
MYPFDRFTERAKKVLSLAQQEAERANHSYIGTEHLLLGLLQETEGVAAKVLTRLGIGIDKVRQTIESVLGRNERLIIQQIIPTSRVKKVIEIAFQEAQQMGDNYVGTEHLLLGLMVEGEGIAAHVLVDLGVNLPEVKKQVVGLRKAGPELHPSEAPSQLAGWTRKPSPGARVLVHDPEPPHRIWEGRLEGLEEDGQVARIAVANHPSRKRIHRAGWDRVHALPLAPTLTCAFCLDAPT